MAVTVHCHLNPIVNLNALSLLSLKALVNVNLIKIPPRRIREYDFAIKTQPCVCTAKSPSQIFFEKLNYLTIGGKCYYNV